MAKQTSTPEALDEGSDYRHLDAPAEGVPDVVEDAAGLQRAIEALRAGTGPVAIDAERASGYRYGQRAYLIQIRREGSGSWLIDPIPFDDLTELDEALADAEWVLHAATQDIPCLAELGMRPRNLFDTELGARLAGVHRVGLAAVLEYYLGITLAKEHSAVDWSTRPLPEPWLRYAALDVELLVELRDRMERDLREQHKWEFAAQEFEALTHFVGPEHRPDPWRRTSGMHRVRSPRGLATVRELWLTRDSIARRLDVTTTRVLPDATIVDLAAKAPGSAKNVHKSRAEKTPSRQRRASQGLATHEAEWIAAIERAAALDNSDLPEIPTQSDTPPPARSWSDRDEVAADRLGQVRADMTALSEHYDIPLENLLTPDVLRRAVWRPPVDDDGATSDEAVHELLTSLGARPWQADLASPVIARAVNDITGHEAAASDA